MSERVRKNSASITNERKSFLVELAEEVADDFCADLDRVNPELILREHGSR